MEKDQVEQFKEQMREEFAKIPKNLSAEDYFDRSERCLSMSSTLRQEGDVLRAKKYELLSQKYKQLGEEKKNPKPKTEVAEVVTEVIIEEKPVEKKKWYHKVFKIFTSDKEVTIEETAEVKEEQSN